MNYQEWEKSVPVDFTADVLWKMKAYRLSMFLAEICWEDITKLSKDIRTRNLSGQLYRAVGSISANIAEGYSRNTGKDRVRFYAYSLGSAREARGWYYQARHILGEAVVTHRIGFLTRIIQLLLTMIPSQRNQTFKEEPGEYNLSIDLETDKAISKHDARENDVGDLQ